MGFFPIIFILSDYDNDQTSMFFHTKVFFLPLRPFVEISFFRGKENTSTSERDTRGVPRELSSANYCTISSSPFITFLFPLSSGHSSPMAAPGNSAEKVFVTRWQKLLPLITSTHFVWRNFRENVHSFLVGGDNWIIPFCVGSCLACSLSWAPNCIFWCLSKKERRQERSKTIDIFFYYLGS